jgi:hypothetical protein
MGKASRKKIAHRAVWGPNGGVAAPSGTPGIRLVAADLPQEEKISHALAVLLQAEVPDGSPLADYRAALDFIVFAWNLSLLGTDERTAALRKLSMPRSGVVDATQREAVRAVERLMHRKQAMFPDDRRQIMSWQARFKGDSVRVTAGALAE